MEDKFQLEQVQDLTAWDNFVKETPQYTVFSSSAYLKSFGGKFKLFVIKKGIIIRAGFCVLLSDDEKHVILDDLVIYGGLFFRIFDEQKPVKARSERFEITQMMIEFLLQNYKSVHLALSTEFEDLRPFLWHNYHLSETEKFNLSLRYTSYLDISSLASFENEEDTPNFKNLEILRQRNIRKARKEQAFTVEEWQIELFLKFYENMMNLQGEDVAQTKLSNMGNVIRSMLDCGNASMFVTKNSKQQILYITVFIFDERRAYYLFGAGDEGASEHYKGTICFWDAFIALAQKYNVKVVDLEGINSPKRGWFKLSFGGAVVPYYEISHKGNK